MENLNVVNDTQTAVVEPSETESRQGASVSGTPDINREAEFTDRRQTASQNSGFRKMRLENERQKREIEALKTQISGMSDYSTLSKQRDTYLKRLVDDKMSSDLKKIQKLDPSIKSLESIGGDFAKLIQNGIDASVAYIAVKRAAEGARPKRPPMPGAIGVTEKTTGEFFTSRELDRLTSKDLENPAIFKKAMESLKRL